MPVAFTTTLRSNTISATRRALWRAVAVSVLGDDYDLSIVCIGDKRMHRLNFMHRGKDKPTNVLSFPLSESMGELFLDIPYSIREAPKFSTERPARYHLDYLFIHGLLHLAGHDHGDRMEKEERHLMKKYFHI